MASILGPAIRTYRQRRRPRPWSVQDLANCLANDTPPFASGDAAAIANVIQALEAGGVWALPDADLMPLIDSCARCLGLSAREKERLRLAGCASFLEKFTPGVTYSGLDQGI